MKVKCISEKLNTDQLHILGNNAARKNHFSISIGKEYTVFGLTSSFGDMGCGCFVQLLSDYDHLVHIPIVLFEIVDSRLSKYWELKRFADGDIAIWPPSLYQEYYHDDLSEDVYEVIEDFKLVKAQILHEFD